MQLPSPRNHRSDYASVSKKDKSFWDIDGDRNQVSTKRFQLQFTETTGSGSVSELKKDKADWIKRR